MQIGIGFALAAGFMLSESVAQSWVSMVIAAVVMLCVAAPITLFARRLVVTGSLVSYIAHELPPSATIVAAASLFVGYAIATASLVSGTVIFVSGAVLDLGVC